MAYYKCKREVWTPSPLKDYPDVLKFEKGNLYLIENNETIDEEGDVYRFESVNEPWFSRHFKQL